MSRSRVRERERLRAAVQTTDPAALATFAGELRPAVTKLRELVEDATARPVDRVHSRLFLRTHSLKALRELEARIDAAALRDESAGRGRSDRAA